MSLEQLTHQTFLQKFRHKMASYGLAFLLAASSAFALRCESHPPKLKTYGCFDHNDCKGGRLCMDGECVFPDGGHHPVISDGGNYCRDECLVWGEKRCLGDGYEICGEYDNKDACQEWGRFTVCGKTETCKDKECVCLKDNLEENDSRETASEISLGTVDNLRLCSNDLDWFKLFVSVDQKLTAQINFLHADGDLNMFLYNSRGDLLGNSHSQNDMETTSHVQASSDYLYLKVYALEGAANTYSLITCLDECSPAGIKECASLNDLKECGEYDDDVCLEWSEPAICTDGYCQNSECCLDADGDSYGTGCGLSQDCDDNNPSLHEEISCRYNGDSCGDYQLCLGACPEPPLEVCDNQDNNCDGNTDENLTRNCLTACGTGLETCLNGSWVDCTAPLPATEICDGYDNDCDNYTDEKEACGKIAFVSDRDGIDYEICIMNADGSNQSNLTNNSTFDYSPDLSPDGTKIVFTSLRDEDPEIYVMNADGSNPIRLTYSNNAYDCSPDWSPDGSKIAFASTRDGNFEIYVMNANGSNQVRLTNTNLAYDDFPDWSPDGTKIVFNSQLSDEDIGNDEIYVINADGSNPIKLTDSPRHDFMPDWSPDGRKIAFVSYRDGNSEIYVMNADGSDQVRLTYTTFVSKTSPDWSPDGTKIAFASWDENTEIYIMNADGSAQTNLTNNPASDTEPSWSW